MDPQLNLEKIADAVASMQCNELANAAWAALDGHEYMDSRALERLTGTKASTWRYWASIGSGPPSFKLGRRRVWRKAVVLAWIADQQAATGTGGVQ